MKRIPGIPVLRGVLRPSGTVVHVWCSHCDKPHFHGWTRDLKKSSLSHRAAHCVDPDSPFHKTGYMIGLLPKEY